MCGFNLPKNRGGSKIAYSLPVGDTALAFSRSMVTPSCVTTDRSPEGALEKKHEPLLLLLPEMLAVQGL